MPRSNSPRAAINHLTASTNKQERSGALSGGQGKSSCEDGLSPLHSFQLKFPKATEGHHKPSIEVEMSSMITDDRLDKDTHVSKFECIALFARHRYIKLL